MPRHSSTVASYTSLLKKPLKESSTISPKWKFTWLSQITTNQASSKKELQKLFTKEWEDQWEEKKRRSYPGWQTFCQKPHKNNLKLYKELQKAEASLLLQIRTGRIGLASFLFRAGASDFPTPLCVCGQAEETANISPLHALFIQDKDNKSLLIPKTSPLLFQTQSYYRSSCTGLCL